MEDPNSEPEQLTKLEIIVSIIMAGIGLVLFVGLCYTINQ